jgi:phage terminase large subunit
MPSDALAAKVRQWIDVPPLFVREVFDVIPDKWQDKVLEAFPKVNRIAGAACKNPGKTALEAWLGWNFMFTRPHCKVPCTSITGANLRDGLWTEFAKWQNKSDLLKATFTWTQKRIFAKQHEKTWWASFRTWDESSDPEEQANTIAGLHEDYLLWLLDEASDIPDGVVARPRRRSPAASRRSCVIMGNCTQTAGPLYRACNRAGCGTSRASPATRTIPKRSPRIDIEEARRRSRVRPRVLLREGEHPRRVPRSRRPTSCSTCATASSRGCMSWTPRVLSSKLQTDVVAEQLIKQLEELDGDAAFVDRTGVGVGVINTAQSRGYGRIIHGISFAQKAIEEERFFNRRAEMYWSAAEWVKNEGCLPKDSLLAAELAAHKYSVKKGRIILEEKDDVKARLGRSPDRADAFVLTFAAPVQRRVRDQVRQPPVRGATSINDYDPLAG